MPERVKLLAGALYWPPVGKTKRYSMKEKTKEAATYIGSFLLLVLVIGGIYMFSYLTHGELTTAKSCSGSYLGGEMNINSLRKQCPSLSNKDLVNSASKYFETHAKSGDGRSKYDILEEIDKSFK